MALEEDAEEPEEEVGVRVLLVEDHAAFREALASTFQAEGFVVVGQAGSAGIRHPALAARIPGVSMGRHGCRQTGEDEEAGGGQGRSHGHVTSPVVIRPEAGFGRYYAIRPRVRTPARPR